MTGGSESPSFSAGHLDGEFELPPVDGSRFPNLYLDLGFGSACAG
jgi:hypothetical protein